MHPMLGKIRQIGFICRDIENAIQSYSNRFNVGPFMLINDVKFPNFFFDNKSSNSPRISFAFSYIGDLQVEFITQLDNEKSCYTEFSSEMNVTLHHYSYWPNSRNDYENCRNLLIGSGYRIIMESRPDTSGRFAYFKNDDTASPIIEISEALIASNHEKDLLLRKACHDWDNSNSSIIAF